MQTPFVKIHLGRDPVHAKMVTLATELLVQMSMNVKRIMGDAVTKQHVKTQLVLVLVSVKQDSMVTASTVSIPTNATTEEMEVAVHKRIVSILSGVINVSANQDILEMDLVVQTY